MGAPVALLAFLAMLGVGMLREGNPTLVTLVPGAILLLGAGGVTWLFRDRLLGAAVGPPIVGFLTLLVLPVYFPGERGPALAAGLGTLATAIGRPPNPLLASHLDSMLPGFSSGRRPLAVAAPATPKPLPASVVPAGSDPNGGDLVALPYEGEGRSLRIPVALDGPDRTAEVTMIFDTGATFTTLNRATLRQLGIVVQDDAPMMHFQTAGGERESPLVYLDRVWVGGFSVEGVTVGVCEDCANDGSVGLLGLNVSRRFLITVDQARQELILEPRTEITDSTTDIGPWIELEATATQFADGRVEVVVDLKNNAPRDLLTADVLVACGEGWTVPVGAVRSGQAASATVSLGLGADCPNGYSVSLERAVW